MRGLTFWTRSILCAACLPVVASAQTVVFSENFDGGTGVNRFDSFLSNATGNGTFDANFDYSTFNYKKFSDGTNFTSQPIPPAPGGTSATGLKISVNDLSTGTNAVGMALLPKDTGSGRPSVSDSFTISYDMWMNYAGPRDGAPGSTEFTSVGINKDGTGNAGVAPGGTRAQGYTLAVDGEAGTTGDYRGYLSDSGDDGRSFPSFNQTWTGQVENTLDGSTPVTTNPDEGATDYHQSIFPLSEYETPGAPGKHWVHASIEQHGNIVDYYLNGQHINTLYLLAGPAAGVPTFGYVDTLNGNVAVDDADEFVIYDNIVVTQLSASTKFNATSGDFSDPGKWTNGVPSGPTKDAVFEGASGAANVTVGSPVSLRGIVFNNANSVTLGSGTSSTITLGALANTVATYAGSHTINAPLVATGHLSIFTNTSTSLMIANLTTDPTKFFEKTGKGILTVNKIRAKAITVSGGTLELPAGGGTSRTGALDLGGSEEPGVLDLNSSLIIDYTLQSDGGSPPVTNSPLTYVYGRTVLGYNGGDWAPSGNSYILSSSAHTVAGDASNPHKTGVGYGEASTVLGPTGGMFNGEAVDGDSVLLKYTYLGDANMDGKVNALDFNILASNYGNQNFPGWTEGDTNYDAVVDTTDFNNLATNFNLALPASPLATLVPEPSALLLMAGVALGAGGRRRRI